MVNGGTNFRKKANGRHKKREDPPGKEITVAENMVIEESVVDECIIGDGSTMDDVEEGQSKQTISESKVEEIPLPDVAEEFIAPTGYRFMDMQTIHKYPCPSGQQIITRTMYVKL